MTSEQMWCMFSKQNKIDAKYESWAFCGGGKIGDELAELVLKGEKVGTASAFISYGNDDKVPEAGDYSVVLYDDKTAACIIQTTAVSIVPFNKVSAHHAFMEGEGDKTLEYWREVHKRAFTPDYKEKGLSFDEKGLIVLEEFKVAFKP